MTTMSMRRDSVQELIESEKIYLKHLNLLVEKFMWPIQQEQIITRKELDEIFGNLQQIRNINQWFYDSLAKQTLGLDLSRVQVNESFRTFLPFFKVYTEFVNNHNQSSRTLEKCVSKNLKLKILIKRNEANPAFDGLDLNDLLITPVQRIPRYSLLLEGILKHSTPNMDDFYELPKILKEIKELGFSINQSASDSEDWIKICKLEKQFANGRSQHIAMFGRKLILVQVLQKRNVSSSISPYTFFLFNDMLLYAHRSLNGYVIHHKFPVYTLVIRALPNVSTEPLHRIEVLNTRKSFIVCCPTKKSQKKWMDNITEAIRRHPRKAKQIEEVKSCWVSDDSSDSCFICFDKFTMIRRRHHCRECGSLVCGSCTIFPRGTFKYHVNRRCMECIKKETTPSP